MSAPNTAGQSGWHSPAWHSPALPSSRVQETPSSAQRAGGPEDDPTALLLLEAQADDGGNNDDDGACDDPVNSEDGCSADDEVSDDGENDDDDVSEEGDTNDEDGGGCKEDDVWDKALAAEEEGNADDGGALEPVCEDATLEDETPNDDAEPDDDAVPEPGSGSQGGLVHATARNRTHSLTRVMEPPLEFVGTTGNP